MGYFTSFSMAVQERQKNINYTLNAHNFLFIVLHKSKKKKTSCLSQQVKNKKIAQNTHFISYQNHLKQTLRSNHDFQTHN